MSTLDANKARLSADDRYELASRAQNQERVNSPRHFVAFGIVLLVIAFVVLVSAWRSQVNSVKQNEFAATTLVDIENTIEEIRALEAQGDSSPDSGIYDPLPDILSTIQSLGKEANLKSDVRLPRNQGERTEGEAILKTYPYDNINDPSLERLLDWVRLAEEKIPGLHVREISITPRQQHWSMNIVLARYERKP
jgi:type II secretory pathway pseudopilin PulG